MGSTLDFQTPPFLFMKNDFDIQIKYLFVIFHQQFQIRDTYLIFYQFKFILNTYQMSKQKKQEYLKFGQIIRIHGHRCLNQAEEKRGMIVAKGFTDPDAKYRTFDNFRNCQFYRQSLFQILPKGPFSDASEQKSAESKKKIQEAYDQLIKQRSGQIIKFGEDIVFKHVDSKEYLSGSVGCSKGGKGAFKVQLSLEMKMNLVFRMYPFRSFENEGDKIKLESPLRIKNMENMSYISTEINKQDLDQSIESPLKMSINLQPQLNKQKQHTISIVTTYSKDYTWLIHLHLQHQKLQQNDEIQTHDIILLTYTKNKGYLCLEKVGQNKFKPIVKQPREKTEYPCYTCLWEIEKQPIPDISPYSDKNKGVQNTYTLRDILTNEYLRVLPLQKEVLLKENKISIITQTIKSLDETQITIKSAKGLTNISDFIKHNGLVKISGPKIPPNLLKRPGQIDVIEDQNSIVLDNPPNLRFRQEQPYINKPLSYKPGDGEHGFRILKIDQQSKEEVLFILSTYEALLQFSGELEIGTADFQKRIKAKRFKFIDEVLRKLIAFIKQCPIQDIEGDNLPNNKKQLIMKDLKICIILFNILKSMGVKILEEIYKKDKSQNDSFKTVFNRAYYLILQIIKNNEITKLYVCQDWLGIILDHAIQNQQETVHQTLNEILQSNEKVVKKFLTENQHFLVHRIINIFTLKPPHQKFLNIFRASCISNGSPEVANQEPIRTIFFDQLKTQANFLFLIPRQKRGISLDVAFDRNKLYLECCICKDQKKIRTLKQFFDESSKLDLSQTSNYFISYLNLLADICYGRNTQSKKYVQRILTPKYQEDIEDMAILAQPVKYDALYTLNYILQDKEIEQLRGYKNLLRAVLRLITYAFVQSNDLDPVLRIKRYRNIDKMQKLDSGEREKFKKLETVMEFVKKNLQNFKSFYEEPLVDENEQNKEELSEKEKKQREEKFKRLKKDQEIRSFEEKQFLETELNLIKSTLLIGYWSVEEQESLLPILLKILKNEEQYILHFRSKQELQKDHLLQQFKIFKEQSQKNTPSVQMITKCKALACQLVYIIFDFRHDNLVTKCVSAYKQLQYKSDRSQNLDHSIIIDDNLNIDHEHEKQILDSNKWKNKLSEIFEPPSSEKKNGQNKKKNRKLIPLMVELSIHKNPILFQRSLSILKRYFEYREEILQLFLNLSIYDNDSGDYLESQIAKQRECLSVLEEENKLYTGKKSYEENNYASTNSFLAWLTEALKLGFNLYQKPDWRKFNDFFEHFHEKTQINHFYQRIIKNKDLHPVFLKFIGLSRRGLSAFQPQAKQALKYVYRFLALLCKGFVEAQNEMKDYIPIINRHIEEQIDLVARSKDNVFDKDITRQIAKKRDDCEAIQLLAQLFSHNKSIIFNEQQIQKKADEMCTLINKLELHIYYKSHLLDFYRSMIYYKDKQIQINQKLILAKLQDSEKKKIYYRVYNSSDEDSENLTNYILQLIDIFIKKNLILEELEKPGNYRRDPREIRECIIGPELTYFITLFNLFANLVEGKQRTNIGKCRQVHSYDMLMKILKKCHLCYPLKTTTRNYINQLYYSTEIEEDLFSQILKSDLSQIIHDLNLLITILVKDVQVSYEIVHPVRYKYFETYIFLYIEQILLSLNYLFIESDYFKQEISKELKELYTKGYYYLHYFVIRIYERLRWLTNYYYEHHYLRGLLNMITNKIRIQFLEIWKESAYRIFDRNQQNNNEPDGYNPKVNRQKQQLIKQRQQELKRRSGMYLHRLIKGEVANFFKVDRKQKSNNFPLTFTLPYEEQSHGQDKKELEKKEKQIDSLAEKIRIILFPSQKAKKKKIDHHLVLQTISDSLKGKIAFNNFIEDYLITSCEELFTINEDSKQYYDFSQPFVSFEEYIKQFVNVNTKTPENIKDGLRIFFFKVIFQFIIKERNDEIKNNPNLDEQTKNIQRALPIQSWSKDDWANLTDQIKKKQQFLVESNVAELIIESLKNADDNLLFSSILRFCIAFLLGGNKRSQDSIYIKLKQDEKNDVFIKLSKLISKLGKKITSRIYEKTNKIPVPDDQFVADSLDLYDYYDPEIRGMKKFHSLSLENKNQEAEQKLQKQVFTLIFKFLQLLCECNHTDLKNFVREQINMDGKKKNYSFNVINVATFQIRRLFKVMNKEASQIIIPLVNFLNEVVTIPCIQNQKSLCETTFFQDLCYMASFFEQEGNRKLRQFEIGKDRQKLNQIYKQCILIILNVLECSNEKLIKELLMKVKARFLLSVIQKNLSDLQLTNEQVLSQYLQNELQAQRNVHPKIQDAMNVMIVMEKLQLNPGSDKFSEQKQVYLHEINKGADAINLKELLVILRNQMVKIQIVSTSSEKKQFVYFPKHPVLKTLSPTTRDRIMMEVSRSSQRQKIRSLFEFKEEIIQQIKFNFRIEKQKLLGLIPYKPNEIEKLRTISFYMGIIINMIWFATTDIIIEYFQVIYHIPKYALPILTVLKFCQFTVTSLYFYSYCRLKQQLAKYRSIKEDEEIKQETKQKGEKQEKKQGQQDHVQQQIKASPLKRALEGSLSIIRFIMGIIIHFISQSYFGIFWRFDLTFRYISMYLVFSVLGTFHDQKFFLIYILFYFMEHETLSNIFNAIIFNIKQLLSVSMLGVVFVYVFCIIFFETYSLDMMSAESDDTCVGILGCIMDLYVSYTISGSVEQFKIGRFTTDLLWYTFFELLFGNIVKSIMVNSFAELRGAREAMDDDKKNKCYICGKDRGMLEKNNEKFEQHITEKHFLWNYIYYMYCLEEKHETDYSGLEYEINNCILSQDNEQELIKWIPFSNESQGEYASKIIELQETMVDLSEKTRQKVSSIKNSQKNVDEPEEPIAGEQNDDG